MRFLQNTKIIENFNLESAFLFWLYVEYISPNKFLDVSKLALMEYIDETEFFFTKALTILYSSQATN